MQPPTVVDASLLLLSQPIRAEAGVIIGYAPGRTPKDPRLILGPSAKLRLGTIIYGGSRIGARLETGHNVVIRDPAYPLPSIYGNFLPRYLRGISDVAMQCQRVVRVREACHGFLQQLGFNIQERHAPALGEETSGGRKSDAARGAGDQGHLLRGRGHLSHYP